MLSEEYPVKVACEALGVTRSSYYYQPIESPNEAELKAAIKLTIIQSSPFPLNGKQACEHNSQKG